MSVQKRPSLTLDTRGSCVGTLFYNIEHGLQYSYLPGGKAFLVLQLSGTCWLLWEYINVRKHSPFKKSLVYRINYK
jgi:hypothetical protein